MSVPAFAIDEERSRLASEAAQSQRYKVKQEDGYYPRRMLWTHLTPLEQRVRGAMLDVEKRGAHRLLTDAVILLEQAGRALADWYDLGCPGSSMEKE